MSPSPSHLLLLTPAPITPVMLHVLIALADGDRHGYGIMQDVTSISDGRFRVGPGTFYSNLDKLFEWGLVRDATGSPEPDADSRRRYYSLTQAGRQVLSTELTRLDALLAKTRRHILKTGEFGGGTA